MSAALGANDVRRARRVAPAATFAVVAVAAAALGGAGWYASRWPSAGVPPVDRDTVVFDTVVRGTLVRSVHGDGTIAANAVRVVAAPLDGEVDAVFVLPGTRVVPGAAIARLRNPEIEAAIPDALAQISAAEADVRSAQAIAQTARIDQRASLAALDGQRRRVELEARTDADLDRQGLIAHRSAEQARLSADDLATRTGLQASRGTSDATLEAAKIAAARARLADLRVLLAAKRAQLDALSIHAAATGVVQKISVQPGQRVAAGTTLVQIADTADLKAVLHVADADVRALAPGQRAMVDVGNERVRGRVTSVAPAGDNGTIAVDVGLEGALPRGIRPDLTVDGTIEVQRLLSVLSLARPAGGEDGASLALYKRASDGATLVRVPVRLGRGSAERVQIVSGLAAGDRVAVSDLSAFGGAGRLRLR